MIIAAMYVNGINVCKITPEKNIYAVITYGMWDDMAAFRIEKLLFGERAYVCHQSLLE